MQVPGLAERRPSVLRGDKVYIFSDEIHHVRFEGVVHEVTLTSVKLGVDSRYLLYV